MTIKLQKLDENKKEGKITFLIKNSTEAFVNTVRRLILEEVPTLAVEDVEIKDNDSALYDEMLALRLGLTPIKTDLKSYRLPENEAEIEERSARCTLQLKLKSSKKGNVYAGETESADPKCNFVQEKMIITKLLPKQKLDVTMYAVMGTGKVHVKWAPGWGIYRKGASIKVSGADASEVEKIATDSVLTVKGGKITVNEDKLYKSNMLHHYEQIKGVEVTYNDDLVFSLESWGQLSCREILSQTAIILKEKAETMEKLI